MMACRVRRLWCRRLAMMTSNYLTWDALQDNDFVVVVVVVVVSCAAWHRETDHCALWGRRRPPPQPVLAYEIKNGKVGRFTHCCKAGKTEAGRGRGAGLQQLLRLCSGIISVDGQPICSVQRPRSVRVHLFFFVCVCVCVCPLEHPLTFSVFMSFCFWQVLLLLIVHFSCQCSESCMFCVLA